MVLISYILIKVADGGIGIPKSEYPNIFKRFYRGGSPEIKNGKSAGVGLYLVRQTLERQGDSVCAAACGEGTAIQLQLPLSTDR